MADVSISVNQTDNQILDNQNSFKKIFEKIFKIFKIFLVIITLAIIVALVLTSFNVIKFKSKENKAIWIEIFSQCLTALFIILSLIPCRGRVTSLVLATQILFKSKDNENYIKKQRRIKKHTAWYNEKYDSLPFLMLIHGLYVLNISSQFVILVFMLDYSSYDSNGNIILPMITSRHRPIQLLICFTIVALSSSVISGILMGYKKYKKHQLRKVEPTINDKVPTSNLLV